MDIRITTLQAAALDATSTEVIDLPACFHCGTTCPDLSISAADHYFCCAGCRTVHDILRDNGLSRFYALNDTPGVRMDGLGGEDFSYLDDKGLRDRIVDFTDGTTCRVTFHIPAIHCVACVWLLENLFQMKPGIGRSEVNFSRREVAIQFEESKVALSELVSLLASLGYKPALDLGKAAAATRPQPANGLALRIGIAGFAFGNIMLLSFPSYLGLNPATEGLLQRFLGVISLILATPVLLFCASDYWHASWVSFRQRALRIEVPIALGLAALFLQSLYDIALHRGEGYLDSFAGLVFLLLCGRWFQSKTYETLAFDRDYTSYFPLSVVRRSAAGDRPVPITDLHVGDRLMIRHNEIVPADAILISGDAAIDYSFVTGESSPVTRESGERLFAGGRQTGSAIEIEMVKPVSQSYLTSLWNSETFRKPSEDVLHNLTNTAGRYFTYAVIVVALGVATYWYVMNTDVAMRAFTSVLIVACPCALALAAPFTLGTAMRILGRNGVYLRSAGVVESMASLDTIVFDKTGTLTSGRHSDLIYQGEQLTEEEYVAIASVARHSTHPMSRAIAATREADELVESYREAPACGVEGSVRGHAFRLGSKTWLAASGDDASAVYVEVDGRVRGRFLVRNAYRPCLGELIRSLSARFKMAVISGDSPAEKATLTDLYGSDTDILFGQSPHDKLAFVRDLQARRRRVLMLGDGLNDAGALKQGDVGIAVAEDIAAFTPSSDAILDARQFGNLSTHLAFSRSAVRILKAAFAISLTYNVVSVTIAATGHLSPMISAMLMPLSSFSVIGFSVGATHLAGRRHNLR